MTTASDRLNYLDFLSRPDANRYEIGFIYLGKLVSGLTDNYELGLSLIVTLMFILAAFAIRNLMKEQPILSVLYFSIIFFGSAVLYSFIQLRSGIALWYVIFFYSLYLRSEKKKFLFLTFFGPLFHLSAIPFVILITLHHIFKFNLYLLIGAISIGFIMITVNLEFIIHTFGLGSYYFAYVDREINPNVRRSLTIISYLVFIFCIPFIWNRFKRENYKLILLFIPSLIFALITSQGLYVKSMFAFTVLTWIWIPKLINDRIHQKEYKNLFYVASFGLMGVTILYSLIRTNII